VICPEIFYVDNNYLPSLEQNASGDRPIFLAILVIMVPSVINLVLSEMVSQINVVHVGKLNDVSALAGIGLATSLIQCLPISLTYGIASVLETMVSQAYGSQ
jgi:Na+-driven multidrug efflux pump